MPVPTRITSRLNPHAKEFKPFRCLPCAKPLDHCDTMDRDLPRSATMSLLVFDLLINFLKEYNVSFTDDIVGVHSSQLLSSADCRALLANLSVVQRAWSIPAREVLYRRVTLRTHDTLRQIFDAETLHSKIKELRITPYPDQNDRSIRLAQLYKTIYGEDTWRVYFERDSALGCGFPANTKECDPFPYGRQRMTQCLLMRLPNLRHLCIEIGAYGGYENPGGLEPTLHAISRLSQLEGLVLTSNGVCTDPDKPRYSYPYFISLCSTLSKLRQLKYLHISHWSCLPSQIDDALPAELNECTPPENLKTIIMEVIDEPLPVHYLSWLLRPRGNFAPANFMLRAAEVIRDQFLSSFTPCDSILSSISHLNIDSKVFVSSNVSNIVLACTSLRVLHLNFTVPAPDFPLPPSVEELRFRLFEMKHSDCQRMDQALAKFLSARKTTPSEMGCRLQSVVVEPELNFDGYWNDRSLCEHFPMTAASCQAANVQFNIGRSWEGKEGLVIADFLALSKA